MSLWRQVTRGLRVLTNRTAADRDVADEVQHYLEQAAADLEASGLSPDDAWRAARVDLGNVTVARERVRAYGWENVVVTFIADLFYAARQLRRNPGFAAVSVLTLALGIGAATAIFSAANPILFEPLPYPTAGRILTVWDNSGGSRLAVTFGTYRELAQRSRSFETIGVMKPWQPTVTGPGRPERLEGQKVSAGYFRVLGVAPVRGRDFQASDDIPSGTDVVILSDALWRRRFGGDNSIVGHQITLDDKLSTVIGVMPGSFENVAAPSAELWSPLQYDMSLNTAWGHHLRMIGRLRPGVGADQARRECNTIAHSPVPEFPRVLWASLKNGFIVNSLQQDVTSAVRPALLAVLGAVMLVLTVACVNVVNLLLARGARRRGELAMRAALGAGRIRLVRQLLSESLLLAFIGGALGMLVAEVSVGALPALGRSALPREGAIRIDGPVLLFAVSITTLIGLVVGLITALHASRGDLYAGVQQSSRWSAADHQLTRRTLVVAEVALALVLLAGAGLLLRSLHRLFAVDPGFDASHLLTMQVQTSGRRFDKATTQRFFAQALEATRRVPGAAAAAFTSQLPLSGDNDEYGAHFEGDDPNTGYNVFRYAVSPGYFETIGIPLRRGRLLDAHDVDGAPLAVLISESLAKGKFTGQNPLGRRVHIGPASGPGYTIVGVVGDVKQASLAVSQPDAVYITTSQSWFVDNALSLVVRARADAAALTPAIMNVIWAVDKDQPIVRVATMEDLLAASAAKRHFALILFELFGFVALVLAAVGIYGVLSVSVTERMREIGVRLALGASRGQILNLVVRQGMALAALGIVIGLGGALVASRALVTLLFGLSRLDPMTYLGVIALLLGVSGIACWLPAWRAARIDPSITLRAE